MSEPLKIPTKTAEAQHKASDPKRSAWVSANAGSGKTYVLTQRVIRLMLEGCNPSRILCLTFTKAAAAEMSNRVFKSLGNWSTLSEEKLKLEIEAIEQKPATPEKIIRARQLFAKALETPGGLKIQTIHAFCEALLHQFPIEANVPGHFSVMDTAEQMILIGEAKRGMILEASGGKNQALTHAFAATLNHTSDDGFARVLDELIAKRDKIGRWLSHVVGRGTIGEYVNGIFDLRDDESVETIAADFVGLSEDKGFWQGIQSQASNSKTQMDLNLAEAIDQIFKTTNKLKQFKVLKPILFTQANKPRANSASAAMRKTYPDLVEKFMALVDEITVIEDRLKGLELAKASTAFFTLADDLLGRFDGLKKQRGLLDFEDLIIRTANLLQRSDARAWVQFKLDRGIDHILIDEAQDTSPRQWEVINAIIDEFYAGSGARDVERTVFAVGDEKQSIYSFQGAEPDAFADQRDRVAQQAAQASSQFESINLALSFRSTHDVLSAVDKVFELEKNYRGLGRDAQKPIHETIRTNDPGRVDIWPIFKSDTPQVPEHWADPVDHLGNSSPIVQLAENIALEVSQWIATGEQVYDKDSRTYRPLTAGDVNILVRSRSQFTTALIRAFKNQAINVAGSDRLVISEHIAVKDLIALGQVMVLSDDDLSLACVLKSPLFGFDEDSLFELANGRNNLSLRQALTNKAQHNPKFASANEQLNRWAKAAQMKPVYEFFAQVLSSTLGRKAFLQRFGSEVQDVLDAFLQQALLSETIGLPGLEAFLADLIEAAPEIKREQDLEKDEVRIMTVHAAKGLEAPVVFLVDHGAAPYNGRHNPKLVELNDPKNPAISNFIWLAGSASGANSTVQSALDEIAIRAEQEYQRLLYVGMTRAADRLILCGYSGLRDPHEDCWYNVVNSALQDDVIEVQNASGLDVLRWQKNDDAPLADLTQIAHSLDDAPAALPEWIHKKLPSDPPLPKPLTPSGAAVLLDEFEPVPEPITPKPNTYEQTTNKEPNYQFERGQFIHNLLQHLPNLDVEQRLPTATAYLASAAAHWDDEKRQKTVALVINLLSSTEFAPLFDNANSRAEVALTGTIEINGKLRMVTGQIDRLVELNDRILLVDYKSNYLVPQTPNEVPKAYLVQMALYKKLLGEIYPAKPVEPYLLWTNAAYLMKLPTTLLEQELASITSS